MQAAIDHSVRTWRPWALAVAILAIVVVPFVLLSHFMQSSLEAAERINHTRQVEATLNALVYDVRNTESAILALAAGIDTPLIRRRLNTSTGRIPVQFAEVAALTRDHPDQQMRVGELKAILDQRAAFTRLIAAEPETARVRADVGEMVTRYPVRDIADRILTEEARLLEQRSAQARQARVRSELVVWTGAAAQLLLLGLLAFYAQRQVRQRLALRHELERASARAQSVLQTVREPIALIDGSQRVVMHNAAFAELYGDEPDAGATTGAAPRADAAGSLHGRALHDIGNGAWDDAVVLQRLADVLVRDRELWDHEQRQRTRDGADRVMLINARRMPLPDRDDRVVLITVSDITVRKATETRILELNRQLEGKIDQVSEVNRELEAFSYSVSHDLRAPLRHIAGFADKLGRHLGERADDKSQHYLDVIGQSSRRMAALIDDLLVYSRLGRSAMRLNAVDMQSMVAETRAILDANVQTDTPGRRIEWRVAPLPMLVGDENMLRQIWLNLLGNAVKYSAGREPACIEVSHERLDDGSHQFSVRDNGAGFDMQYAGKLFGVFQRMHKASEYSGTGIGLASVRRVVTRHGGRIWAEAEAGAGATFHFILPSSLDSPAPLESQA